MAKGDSRIFIITEGGLVTGVFSSNPDDAVTVIDHDIVEDGDDEEQEGYKKLLAELEEYIDDGRVGEVY